MLSSVSDREYWGGVHETNGYFLNVANEGREEEDGGSVERKRGNALGCGKACRSVGCRRLLRVSFQKMDAMDGCRASERVES